MVRCKAMLHVLLRGLMTQAAHWDRRRRFWMLFNNRREICHLHDSLFFWGTTSGQCIASSMFFSIAKYALSIMDRALPGSILSWVWAASRTFYNFPRAASINSLHGPILQRTFSRILALSSLSAASERSARHGCCRGRSTFSSIVGMVNRNLATTGQWSV